MPSAPVQREQPTAALPPRERFEELGVRARVPEYIQRVVERMRRMQIELSADDLAVVERLKQAQGRSKLSRFLGLSGYGKLYIFAVIDAALDLRERTGTLPDPYEITELLKERWAPEENRHQVSAQAVRATLGSSGGYYWSKGFAEKIVRTVSKKESRRLAAITLRRTLKAD